MKLRKELRYTESHEWVKDEGGGKYLVGITDHAQEQLGDIVFVEVSRKGDKVAAGDPVGVVESVKAASDIYAPFAGTIVDVTEALASAPEKVNEDAFESWIYRIQASEPKAHEKLLDSAAYEKSASA